MAKQSVVVNTSDRDYVEEFHGKEYRIPARGELTMSRHEAIEFLGAYNGGDREKPLKIKHLASSDAEQGFMCNACGSTFGTIKALEAHVAEKHETASSDTKKVFVCVFCQAKTNSRQELYAHMKTHKDKKADEILAALDKAG